MILWTAFPSMLLVLVVAAAPTHSTPSEMVSSERQVEAEPIPTEREVQAMVSNEIYKRVTAEREILERQNERQFQAVEKLIDRAIYFTGGLIAVASILLAYFFGRSFKEAQREFQDTFQETLNERAQAIIDSEAELLRARYQSLQSEVDTLTEYKSKNIAWVLPAGAADNSRVLDALSHTGLKSPAILTPLPGAPVEIGDPDLVVLSYDGSDEAFRVLQELVVKLAPLSPPVSLLIYSFTGTANQVRLGAREFQVLGNFDWFVPVNFPAQLLAQIQMAVRQSRVS